ncbi:hypothetical protein GCM10009733_096400 [Nonomuraea maheshkhaliensis]|uniref:Uncharacterized protein n=1 Tax=Nonomuraea maheshkhaliensis TaxID=419590 RepID=A0ABP4TAJ4_9ACTN
MAAGTMASTPLLVRAAIAVRHVGDLAELPLPFGRGGGGDGVAAQDVDVPFHSGTDPGHIAIQTRIALPPQLT